jgi:hypothetical protein
MGSTEAGTYYIVLKNKPKEMSLNKDRSSRCQTICLKDKHPYTNRLKMTLVYQIHPHTLNGLQHKWIDLRGLNLLK